MLLMLCSSVALGAARALGRGGGTEVVGPHQRPRTQARVSGQNMYMFMYILQIYVCVLHIGVYTIYMQYMLLRICVYEVGCIRVYEVYMYKYGCTRWLARGVILCSMYTSGI